MDNRTIGLIFCGLILTAIITALIFSSKFRKDVIASEGEASVLGLISVKGVVIVLLTAIFGGIFAYILQLDAKGGGSASSTESAIEYLKDAHDDVYSLSSDTGNDSLMVILANGMPIGQLGKNLTKKLTATRSAGDPRHWNIGILKSFLGYVTMAQEDGYLMWNERDTSSRSAYMAGTPYKLKNLNLWFCIDSIVRYQQSGTRYKYLVRFGEGDTDHTITWNREPEQFGKIADGILPVSDEFIPVRHAGWQNDYFLKFGAGQPGTAGPELNSVEMLNIIAIAIRIE